MDKYYKYVGDEHHTTTAYLKLFKTYDDKLLYNETSYNRYGESTSINFSRNIEFWFIEGDFDEMYQEITEDQYHQGLYELKVMSDMNFMIHTNITKNDKFVSELETNVLNQTLKRTMSDTPTRL